MNNVPLVPNIETNLNSVLMFKIMATNNSIVTEKKHQPIFRNNLVMLFFAEICNNRDLCKIYKSDATDTNIDFKTWTDKWNSIDDPTRENAKNSFIQPDRSNFLYSQVDQLLKKPVKTT